MTLIVAIVGIVGAIIWLARATVRTADADEWLLHLRNGSLVHCGQGIRVLRLPGDVIVRFSTAVQRVRFTVCVLTNDRVSTELEGFFLWRVSEGEDAPLRAYRSLGITNREEGRHLTSRHHLLDRPQHHAFQAAAGAAALRYAGRYGFAALSHDPEPLLQQIQQELMRTLEPLGIEVDDLQLMRLDPTDADIIEQLSTPHREQAREQADLARARTREKQEALERRVSEARSARLAAEQHESIARKQAEAEARATRIRTLTAAESEKATDLRQAELERFRIEKMASAFSQLPIQKAEWVSSDDPMVSLARMMSTWKGAEA